MRSDQGRYIARSRGQLFFLRLSRPSTLMSFIKVASVMSQSIGSSTGIKIPATNSSSSFESYENNNDVSYYGKLNENTIVYVCIRFLKIISKSKFSMLSFHHPSNESKLLNFIISAEVFPRKSGKKKAKKISIFHRYMLA